jgi:hypothetical protein
MTARSATPAQGTAAYYRAKRLAFNLALELGVTPAEAEATIAAREARLRWLAAEQRRQGKTRPTSPPHVELVETAREPQPWMMRE